ncbi:MAG: prepilin-type N-terminal cleavage/methylation domain-containing protein [Candidatus Pacebacteria bacterium]|nr:prepilin-type N-terminal cleavage/methylation domain-containing protein [Candidatus Paceibacterota bacterium]
MFIKFKKGFTLIEILVAVAIVAILAGFTMISFLEPQQSANFTKLKSSWAITEGKYINNLIGKWSLDEGSGTTAADSTDFKNNGTLANFANTTAGYGDSNTSGWMSESKCISRTCLKFDGNDDKVTASSSILTGTEDFTVSAWIKRSSAGTVDFILGNYGYGNTNGLEFYIHSNNLLYVYISGSVSSTSTIDTNWHYVVATRTSGLVELYIDSSKNGSGTLASSIGGTNPLTIGNGHDYITEAFIGIIDEVSVYSNAITLSQIKSNYLAGLDKLLAKNLITQTDYNQRIAELEKNNLAEK